MFSLATSITINYAHRIRLPPPSVVRSYPEHESLVGALAERLGFTHVSLSSEVMPMARLVPRGFTAAADAYLTPCIKQYLSVSSLIYPHDTLAAPTFRRVSNSTSA